MTKEDVLEELFDFNCKQIMDDWDLESFKKSHKKLYKSVLQSLYASFKLGESLFGLEVQEKIEEILPLFKTDITIKKDDPIFEILRGE